MQFDYSQKYNLASETIITMEFLLDEGDIEYLIKLSKKDKKRFRIYVNGVFYKLHNIPNSLQIFPRKKQLIKLELEPCEKKLLILQHENSGN